MNILFIYLLGWIIWSISYYIYYTIIKKDNRSKKLIIYRAITSGIISWIGIILFIALEITYLIMSIDEWIENKLQ